MKKHISFVLAAICLTVCYAARTDLKFQRIGLQQGLSHSTITAMGQDRQGYIWIGTPDGLNRFDGYAFRVYRHNPANAGTPAYNDVRTIRFAPDGTLWVAGINALSRYDAVNDRFTNYTVPDKAELNDVLVLDDGHLLAGTDKGLYTFDTATGKFTPGYEGHPFTSAITSLCLADGDVYIAGSGRLSKLDPASGHISPINLGKTVAAGQMLDDGRYLYITTEGDGLLCLDTGNGHLRTYRAGGPEGLRSDYVRSIARDTNGRLWVGTFSGLDILDAKRQHFSHYDNDPYSEESLSHSSVRRIFADRQGGMWLGTYFGGLNYYHPLRNQFQTMRHSPVRPSLNDNIIGAMLEDSRHNIWIATNRGGVNVYNPQNDTFRYFTTSNGLGSDDVKAFYYDEAAGKVYVGSHLGGMNVITPTSGAVATAPNAPSNVYDILPSRRPGALWLAAINALVLYDVAGGISTAVPSNGLCHITDLYRDTRGRLWVSGEDGMAVFDEHPDGSLSPAKGIPESIGNYRRQVNNVYMSRDGHTYYISTNEGLMRYDSSNGKITRYTTAQGMPNDMVYGVLEDANGRLWCSTNYGLALINPADGHIVSYNTTDGLQSNQFSLKSFLKSSDGYMYFGGINGLSYFNPSVLKSNPYTPAPMISGLKLFNRRVTVGDETGLLPQSISETHKITLSPEQSVLTIDFTVCNYVAGEHNTFSYKLDGFDKQWITTDGAHSVTYSNLPPGDYRFMLRAANNDGVWSKETTSIGITVLPHWYQRWWVQTFFILLITAAAAMALLSYLRRRERMRHEQMEHLNAQREKELNEMKVRFFINMSHELRTPLTLMLLPIQELLQRATDRKTVQRLNLVKNNTENILHIVNQLLDYRRAEMGMFRLQTRQVKVSTLIHTIFHNYEFQASRRDITYRFNSSLPDEPVMCDPQYIELICNNLISNAFKYTPKGQSITVSVASGGTEDAPKMVITVADTGCGIPADKLPEIFTRFYKVDDRANGSGIGLSLVKRLVELHHGTISVDSKLGEGTTFTVEIPVNAAAYTAAETLSDSASQPLPPTDVNPAPLAIPEPEEGIDDTAEAAQATDDARETVMVVDDNPDILKYICEALSEHYNVLPAANGAKAIETLSSNTVDLIITDIMMPDIDGVQLCRTVKRNLRTSHIPVIMLSAKSDTNDFLGGLKVGADDYIAKPFSLDILSQKVRNLLHTRRQTIRHFTDLADDKKTDVPALNPLDEEFIKKALDTMEKYVDDSEFTTDRFAAEMCMSRSNLHLKMKALTGESTNEFMRRFRMRRAMDLLKSGRYTISQVSAMVGYGTPSYFATSFKKFFGDLPSNSIKNLRPNEPD